MMRLVSLLALLAAAGDWTAPVEVRHDDRICLAYRARLAGDMLVVRAAVEPGWHTFAMDNQKRAEEKLAGKPSLGIDRPTSIDLSGGLQAAGKWYQTAPRDFSKPELRWFSWGFEGEAVFAARVRRQPNAPARIAIKGQACTESVCKNIDVAIALPADAASAAGFDTRGMVEVR